MYTYIHTCMYVCLYVCMYVCMHVRMNAFVYVSSYVCMCMCVFKLLRLLGNRVCLSKNNQHNRGVSKLSNPSMASE